MQGGNIDGAGVAATRSRPLSLASPPPPFIKKKREWTKADGIFTFMSFKKVNYCLEQVGMAVLSCLLLVVAFINFPRWICC